jgi:hypothetical protein
MGAFPQFVCELDIPTRPEDLAIRYHNKYAKEALFDAVVKWHGSEDGFKTRFKREAKQRFHHFERSEKYKRYKARRYHSTVDLIKTGASKQQMLSQAKIQIGGTGEKGNLTVTVSMRFAFKGGAGRFRKQGTNQEVVVAKMLLELQDCDGKDAELIARWTLDGYMKRLNAHRSARKRIRLPKR